MGAEPTLSDVLDAVNKGFSDVQENIEGLKTDVKGLKSDVGDLRSKVTRIEATMVTKDYLDEKLGRTDGKINKLVHVLEKKTVITAEEKRAVLT